MDFERWRDTHWKWGSSTDEVKAVRAWNSAREDLLKIHKEDCKDLAGELAEAHGILFVLIESLSNQALKPEAEACLEVSRKWLQLSQAKFLKEFSSWGKPETN
jgi:hypothetical protein